MTKRSYLSVLSNIYADKYKSKIRYMIYPKCLECKKRLEGDTLNFCGKCGTPFDNKKFTEKREQLEIEYEEDQNKLFLKFKKDVFEELNLSEHPKKEKLYEFVLKSYEEDYYNLKDIFSEIKNLAKFVKFYDK